MVMFGCFSVCLGVGEVHTLWDFLLRCGGGLLMAYVVCFERGVGRFWVGVLLLNGWFVWL